MKPNSRTYLECSDEELMELIVPLNLKKEVTESEA